MSIPITCPSCGAKANASDAAAGKRAKCRGCGTVIQIPSPALVAAGDPYLSPPAAEPVPTKLCVRCGMDVTHQQPLKDDAGDHYCQPCWDLVNQPAPVLEPASGNPVSVDSSHEDGARSIVDPEPTDSGTSAEPSGNDQAPAEEIAGNAPVDDEFQPPTASEPQPNPQPQAAVDPARAARLLGFATTPNNTSRTVVPDYAGLKWAASCFGFISLLNFILAVLAAIAFGIKIHRDISEPRFDLSDEMPNLLGRAGAVVGILIVALIFRAVSHAILAFRDIARNSWFVALGQLPH